MEKSVSKHFKVVVGDDTILQLNDRKNMIDDKTLIISSLLCLYYGLHIEITNIPSIYIICLLSTLETEYSAF